MPSRTLIAQSGKKKARITANIEAVMPAVRKNKGALFIRCTDEEAEHIRHTAKLERRTVSGFILHAVLSRIEAKERLVSEAKYPPLNRQSQ